MAWLIGCLLILLCIGRLATGELFNFDLSSLRPDELCDPSPHLRMPGPPGSIPPVNFCRIENHIQLFGSERTKLLKNIEHIRNASANRAVSLFMGTVEASLIDASILAPISKQIVQFTIIEIPVAQGDLTSRFPAIGLNNLLSLRFQMCDGLRIHKADFDGLKSIRAIEFFGSSPEFIEEGTFTNLPTLQTLALGNDVIPGTTARMAVYEKLVCDAQNAWLWEFLKRKPGLQESRRVGEIFKLGNFTSAVLDVEKQPHPDVECEPSTKVGHA